MRIRSKAFYARSCEEYYMKAEKEAQKEESKSSRQGTSSHSHKTKKSSTSGRQQADLKSANDILDEGKKSKNYSPQLKELMTNYVMEAGAFDPFSLNEKDHSKQKTSKYSEEGSSKDKPQERVKSKKDVKGKNSSLTHVADANEAEENGGEEFLEVRKRSSSISAIEAMNNGASLPNSLSSSSSSPLSSEEGIEDEDKNNSDDNSNSSNSDDEDKNGKNNSSDSSKSSDSSNDSDGSNSSDGDDSSDDDQDDDEESIRLKESQQHRYPKHEVELYENEYFNSNNNWGRRKQQNMSQCSEYFDENLYCNFENFNGSTSVNLKQIKTNVMIVGESNIGKTELLTEIFTNNQFPSKLNANYSLDLMVHKMSKNEQEYKINLWIQNLSTLQYQWIIEQVYYKIINTFIFLYNDSDATSLDSIKTTYIKTKTLAPNAKYVLIGINTATSPSESKDIQEQARIFSEENNFSHYFERAQQLPIEEYNLNILRHYICPLYFDKDNDSFKCSDFQICQNSTQDSPKSIEFSLNKHISQEFPFTKQIVNQQSPVSSLNAESAPNNNKEGGGEQNGNKLVQINIFREEIANGFSNSDNRRQQKRDFAQSEQETAGNAIKFGGLGLFLDSQENLTYSQSNKIFQQFPLLQQSPNNVLENTLDDKSDINKQSSLPSSFVDNITENISENVNSPVIIHKNDEIKCNNNILETEDSLVEQPIKISSQG